MPVKKISISAVLSIITKTPVFDVRSPGEYNHAHIPGSFSLPLFSDEERKTVGIAYKQQGKQKAIKLGLDFFGVKMKLMVEEVEKLLKKNKHESNKIIVHCWRGGMRSAGVAWLLDLYGFEVYTIAGGYKAYRNWALEQFSLPYKMNILGGYTGSAKTALLKELQEKNENIIDLEGIAHHKGSAFGGIGQPEQPTQEQFENILALELFTISGENNTIPFWLEDESQRIGKLNIPHSLWKTIRLSPLYFIEIPFEERLSFIMQHYGTLEKEALIDAILRIQKRFGPNETKQSINFISEEKTREAFSLLLTYYDKTYLKAMNQRENIQALLKTIPMKTTDTAENINILHSFIHQQ